MIEAVWAWVYWFWTRLMQDLEKIWLSYAKNLESIYHYEPSVEEF